MKVIKEKTNVGPSNFEGRVVLESEKPHSEAFADLSSAEARSFAIQVAAEAGMQGVGLSSLSTHPYAVDAEGRQMDEVDNPADFRVAHYRADYEVTAGSPLSRSLVQGVQG